MSWKHNYATRPQRPKARRITKDEKEELLGQFAKKIEQSPVLTALGCQVSAERGRFYVERKDGVDDELWARITPLEDPSEYLLERERKKGKWYVIAQGGPAKVIGAIANDKLGTFHGLGTLNASLKKQKAGGEPLKLKKKGRRFVYVDTDKDCTAQVALFHYFGIPIHVLTEPREWYIRHRTPKIVQNSAKRDRVLVRFSGSSWSGEPIVGTCLYVRHDEPGSDDSSSQDQSARGVWRAYTIRPNKSESIAIAEAWLVKRKWVPW